MLSQKLRYGLLASCFSLAMASASYAQGGAPNLNCAPKGNMPGIRTNPSAPVNTHMPAKTNTFDWRTPTYQVNWLGGTTVVENPFYQLDNSSINHLYENKDFSPEDGWELFARDFGYNDDGSLSAVPVNIPILVLYNRYTGVFRAFVMRHQYFPYTHVRFQLSFQPTGSGMETALLDQSKPMDALKRPHNIGAGIQSIDRFLNDGWKWHHADFVMTYDPCTCVYKSKLNLSVSFVTQSSINLEGSATGTLTSIANGSGTSSQDGAKWTFAKGTEAVGKFGKVFKGITDFISGLKGSSNGSALSQEDKNKKNAAVEDLGNKLKLGDFLKAGLKFIPTIGDAISLVDFFVSGGKKPAPSGPTEVKLSPTAIDMTIKLSGTISAQYPHKEVIRWNPGSTGATVADGEYPYYNETMGVMNFLEMPILKRTNTSRKLPGGMQYNENYQISEDFKWTLNPAAGLEAQEIEAAILIEIPKADYGKPIWSVEGFDAVSGDAVYRSVYMPIGCMKNKVVSMTRVEQVGDSWGYRPYSNAKFYIKIMANLKRTDGSGQNVLWSAKYPITAQTVTTTLVNSTTECTTVTPAQTAQQISDFCQSSGYKTGRFYRPEHIKEAEEARAEAEQNVAISAASYPNPTNDVLNIDILGNPEIVYDVELHDLSGMVIYTDKITHNQAKINTKTIKDGVYVLHIRAGKQQYYKRVIIKH